MRPARFRRSFQTAPVEAQARDPLLQGREVPGAFNFCPVKHRNFAAFVVVENPSEEPDLHLFRKLQRPVVVEELGSPLRRMAERVVVDSAGRPRVTVIPTRASVLSMQSPSHLSG